MKFLLATVAALVVCMTLAEAQTPPAPLAQTGAMSAPNAAPPAPIQRVHKGMFWKNCGADVQKLCPKADTRREQHRCIRQNEAMVTQVCSQFLAARRALRQEMRAEEAQRPASASPPAMPPAGH